MLCAVMNEWMKLAASASLGLIVGLLLEPLKIALASRAKVRLLRDGLYSNLAFVSAKCNWTLVDELRRSKTKVIYDDYFEEITYVDRPRSHQEILDGLATVDLEVFRYYYEQEKPIFWRLEFAGRIKYIYSQLAIAIDTGAEQGVRFAAMTNVNAIICEGLKDGALDREVFFKYLQRHFGDDYATAYSATLKKSVRSS
jgi:hypothetical protein